LRPAPAWASWHVAWPSRAVACWLPELWPPLQRRPPWRGSAKSWPEARRPPLELDLANGFVLPVAVSPHLPRRLLRVACLPAVSPRCRPSRRA